MESSAAAGYSYSGAGHIGHAVLPSIAMAEPDSLQSAAAAEIGVSSVSPSMSSSAPGIELVRFHSLNGDGDANKFNRASIRGARSNETSGSANDQVVLQNKL